MCLLRRTIVTLIIFMTAYSHVTCDSAGHIKPPPGLAFGGIPYGSVSGQIADYFKPGSHPIIYEYNYKPPIPYAGHLERLPAFEDNIIDD